jgi:hypothetical protein
MYQIAFDEFGYRLPFTDFEVAVLDHLHVAPSQLHPNSLAFFRAFEIVTTYFSIVPTLELFFYAFCLQPGTKPEKIVEGGEKRTVSNDIDQQLLTSTIRLI